MANPTDKFIKGMEPNITWKGDGKGVQDVRARVEETTLGPVSITCWELSEEEYREVMRTGKVYLHVYGMHPPVYVSAANELKKDFGLLDDDEPSGFLAKKLEGEGSGTKNG